MLFTDKTGTLTENVMVFKAASIAGRMLSVEELRVRRPPRCSYADVAATAHHEAADSETGARISERQEKKIHQFLMALCLCHSAQVNKKSSGITKTVLIFHLKVALREGTKDGDLFYGCSNESFVCDEAEAEGVGPALARLEYTATSPDEKAILEGCSELGMKFAGEEETRGTCRVLDTRAAPSPHLKTYRKLHTLEFDSARRRMSVIVRHPGPGPGKTYLVTKGADSSVLGRCVAGPGLETARHIEQCAMAGESRGGTRVTRG